MLMPARKDVMGTLCYSTVPGIYASNRSEDKVCLLTAHESLALCYNYYMCIPPD